MSAQRAAGPAVAGRGVRVNRLIRFAEGIVAATLILMGNGMVVVLARVATPVQAGLLAGVMTLVEIVILLSER